MWRPSDPTCDAELIVAFACAREMSRTGLVGVWAVPKSRTAYAVRRSPYAKRAAPKGCPSCASHDGAERLLRRLLERGDERLQHLHVLAIGGFERLAVLGFRDLGLVPVAIEHHAPARNVGGIELVLLLLETQAVRAKIHHKDLRILLGRAVQILVDLLILLLVEQGVDARRQGVLGADYEQLAAGDVECADVLTCDGVLRGDAIELRRIKHARQLSRERGRLRFLGRRGCRNDQRTRESGDTEAMSNDRHSVLLRSRGALVSPDVRKVNTRCGDLLDAPETNHDLIWIALASADEHGASEPLQVGRGGFERRDGAEIDKLRIDRLAFQQLLHHRWRGVTHAGVLHVD